jgi:hypothetical protein
VKAAGAVVGGTVPGCDRSNVPGRRGLTERDDGTAKLRRGRRIFTIFGLRTEAFADGFVFR